MWIFCVLQRTDSSDCWKPRPHDTDGRAVEVKRRPGGEGRDPGEGAVPQRQGHGGWSEVMSVIRRHYALYIYGHDRHYRLSFFLFFFHNEHENIIYVFLKHLCNFQPNNYKKFLVFNVCCKDFLHDERKVQCRWSIETEKKVWSK